MAQSKIKLDNRKLKQIQKEVKILNNSFTVIGLFSDKHPESSNNLTIADIAFFNEFGTKHIPERPFMRGWFDKNKKHIEKRAMQLYRMVLDGKMKAKRALALLGEYAKGEIQKSITALDSPPNALSTIRIKGSSNPLIDTGIMRSSVRHEEYFNSPIPKGDSI